MNVSPRIWVLKFRSDGFWCLGRYIDRVDFVFVSLGVPNVLDLSRHSVLARKLWNMMVLFVPLYSGYLADLCLEPPCF